jgi:hypothetical protein
MLSALLLAALAMHEGTLIAELTPRSTPIARATVAAEDPSILFGFIAGGELLGTVRFPADWTDYRGTTVPAGTYELHYAIQPRLKDHLDTSDYRDFAILSGFSEGHPRVMALVPPDEKRDGELVVPFETGGVRVGVVIRARRSQGVARAAPLPDPLPAVAGRGQSSSGDAAARAHSRNSVPSPRVRRGEG